MKLRSGKVFGYDLLELNEELANEGPEEFPEDDYESDGEMPGYIVEQLLGGVIEQHNALQAELEDELDTLDEEDRKEVVDEMNSIIDEETDELPEPIIVKVPEIDDDDIE